MAGHGRAFVVAWHEEDTEEALRAAYRAERDVVVRQRLHALRLLRSGEQRMDEVAGLVGAHVSCRRVVRHDHAGLVSAGGYPILEHRNG